MSNIFILLYNKSNVYVFIQYRTKLSELNLTFVFREYSCSKMYSNTNVFKNVCMSLHQIQNIQPTGIRKTKDLNHFSKSVLFFRLNQLFLLTSWSQGHVQWMYEVISSLSSPQRCLSRVTTGQFITLSYVPTTFNVQKVSKYPLSSF